jgi:hypothetical protein
MLPDPVHWDLAWWQWLLDEWNSVSLIPNLVSTMGTTLELCTDACASGYSAFFAGTWLSSSFSRVQVLDPKIAWKELYVICMAIATWGHRLARKHLVLQCDNQVVVATVNSGSSRSCGLMVLLRTHFFICCRADTSIMAIYICSGNNGIADALSWGDWKHFRALTPGADCLGTPPAPFSYIF